MPSRFAIHIPDAATPWRERVADPLCAALVHAGATDEEAADVLAAVVVRLQRERGGVEVMIAASAPVP